MLALRMLRTLAPVVRRAVGPATSCTASLLLKPAPCARWLSHATDRHGASHAPATPVETAANSLHAAPAPSRNAAEMLGARTTRRKRKATRAAPEPSEGETPPELMKVFAVNTADRYALDRIIKWSPTRPPSSLLKDLTDDMYYAKWHDSPLLEKHNHETEQDVFYFDNGTIVLWGFEEDRVPTLVRHLSAFEELPLKVHVMDDFEYRYGLTPGIADDVFVVSTADEHLSPVQQKLAFSIALARSVKLDALEEKCDVAIAKVRDVPRDLEEDESAPLRRRAAAFLASLFSSGAGSTRNSLAKIMSVMREVMQARGELNLYTDLTEDPESYWNNKAGSDLLRGALHHLEIYRRKKALNEKLEYSSSLLQIVWSHHSEQRSLRLEWIIIILIAIEVVFGTIQLARGGH